MDTVNTFETPNTRLMVRGEYFFLLLVSIGITLYNWDEVRIIPLLILFGYIDLIGYIPGAIAYRKFNGNVPKFFYYLYNINHNFVTAAMVALAWCYFVEPEWALMGIPIHLFGDRSLFGNQFKSRQFSFEPIKHPLYKKFEEAFQRSKLLPVQTMPKDKMKLLMEKYGHHASLNLVFNKDTNIYYLDRVVGFIPYRDDGRCLFVFSGVVAQKNDWGTLLDQSIIYASENERKIACVQLRREQAGFFEDKGFSVNQMGCSYTQDLSNFSLRGTAFMSLRNKLKRAERLGVIIKELGTEFPFDKGAWHQIDEINISWLKAKGQEKLLSFMVGELDKNSIEDLRVFAAFKDGQIIGYISYVPSYLSGEGYMHDLTRRIGDAPPGTMELINVTAINKFIEEGNDHLAYGFTPFCGIDGELDNYVNRSRLLSYLLGKLEKFGQKIYPALSQVEYKKKWKPMKIEPEYFAVYGKFRLSYMFRLMKITNAI